MKLASITLPLLDNRGNTLVFVHDYLDIQLLAAFGGYTKLPVQGAWKNPVNGKTYRYNSFVYQVATTDDGKVFEIARDLARLAAQDCIFVVDTTGEAHFIEPKELSVSCDGLTDTVDNAFGAGELVE
jgi:hypothetical protein